MIEILQFSFIQNALLISILVSITCGIIGSLIVVNKMAFIAGGISHGAYGGIGIAIFLGISPLFGAVGFALFLAFIIASITYQNKTRIDSIIGAIWAFGMALGIILIDLSPGYNVDMMSFLFGSILGVSNFDLYFIGFVCLLVFGFIFFFYKEFLAMSFDMEFAKLQNINVKFFYILLIMLMALCIVATIRAVGLILAIALLSISPYIAEKFCTKLYKLMILSSCLSITFSILGLIISFTLNLTAGACIIMVATISFFLVEVFLHVRTFFSKK